MYLVKKYLIARPKFWSVSLCGQRYWTFDSSQLTTMLDVQGKEPKKRKKQPQSKILNYTILLTVLVETLPRSIHEFYGVNLVCDFRGDVV